MLAAAVVVLAATAVVPAAVTDPVRLDTGLVSGTSGESDAVRVYKGIPFAAPPVGPLRWRASQPPAPWTGVRKAEEFGPRCMQGGRGGQAMSEDCLSLNVWTAAVSSSERRPVMVWSYGGAFTGGAGSVPGYDGENLARKGVVVVTYNYRLGPFGWLSHPELTKESGHNASGNQGLTDAVAALKWVQQNIAAFGGDPSRVTIFGESAGGALVAALVASPLAKGLFHRAISESGGWSGARSGPMVALAEGEAAGREAFSALGVSTLAEARAKSAADVQSMARGLRPMVDGYYLPEELGVAYANGRINPVNVLIGSNKDEGNFPFFGLTEERAAQFEAESREQWGELADAFLKMYPAGSLPQSHASQLAAFRDQYSWQMRNWAHYQAKAGPQAYVFYFTQEPPAAPGQPSRGAMHTAEIPYVFNIPGDNWAAADYALASTMSSYWVNFAATGNPNGPGLPAWPAFGDKETGRAMLLGPQVEPEPRADARRFTLFEAIWTRQVGN
jgi:para-nitrobenzyl esterase